MLLSNHMFPSLATRTHCFILTEACSCRLELAYFTGKKMVCKNAVAFAYYGSGRLLVMGSCEVLKPRPKDRNISQHCWAQHVACVWSPCCGMLQRAGCCWFKFDQFQTWANNMSQHVDMSQPVATRWPNARNMLRPTMLRYVALACCDRLAGVSFAHLMFIILWVELSSPGQTIATSQRNISQHC